MRAITQGGWWAVLGALVAVRSAPPLVALAGEGRDLPGLPRFDLVEGTGDDAGFYSTAREVIAAAGRLPVALAGLIALALLATLVVAVRLWRRPELRAWLLVGGVTAFSLAVTVVVLEMQASGSGVVGWSLVWGLALAPARALGVLDYELAFALGFPLLLAANAVALVATAYAGMYATGRRPVGLVAAAALAAWPLVSVAVAGPSAWDNGSWLVDTGLSLYTEPLSTALVTVALALLLRPGRGDLALAAAGIALSYAALVKLSNGVTAAAAIVLVAGFLGVRRTLPLAAGALVFVPVLAAYWPLGYQNESGGRLPSDPFGTGYLGRSWADSLLFSPRTLLILLPLALLGAVVLPRGYALALLLAFVLANAVFYSFYESTPQHPRFLYASLPPFFVLWAAGLLSLAASTLVRWPSRVVGRS